MTSDDKETKTAPAPKTEVAAQKEAAPAKKNEGQPKNKSAPAADASAGYSRGEGQKPVSQAYKDNWNAIYGKKKKKR
jgi:hypothetical protein